MIPFVDLKTQFKHVEKDIRRRMDAVFMHGQYIMGPEVLELEEKLSAFAGTKYCVGCASGTDALLMALMVKNVGPGDAVFTTPFTFIATAEVISLLGATPVFVDIDPQTFNMDVNKLDLAIKGLKTNNPSIYPLPANQRNLKPKGMITVDLFGLPCDYDVVDMIAKEHKLFVIEDAAQGFGGKYKGKMAGSFGDMGCTSFFPAKPLGCYGDAGAIFTDDDAAEKALRSIRIHGMGNHPYDNPRIGLNARIDTLQAAILLPKLDLFPFELDKRQHVADRYSNNLSDLRPHLLTPQIPSEFRSAWAQYSVLSDKREHVMNALKKNEFPTAVYYPKPLHLQGAFAGLGYKEGDMPESENIAKRIFSLPIHPYLEDRVIDQICEVISMEVFSKDVKA
jgi:dTDP-4-amino-4,6-dideoxygalactose transaminase